MEGRGSREWKDLDAAFTKLESDGIDQAVLWNRVPLTVAQAEKAIGKKKFGEWRGGPGACEARKARPGGREGQAAGNNE